MTSAEFHAMHLSSRSSRVTARDALLAIAGNALAVLTALDGSAEWQMIRGAGVLFTTALVLWVVKMVPMARDVVLLVVGVLGVVIGLGIGGMHALKGDLDVQAILALVVLVSALALFVYSTWSMLRLARWSRRVLVIPVAFLLLEFVFLPLTPAIYATNVPATTVGNETPATYGMSYEDVEFLTSDRVRLSAWYVPSHNRAGVVFLHGSGSTRSNVLQHAVAISRHGYGALLLDARGHGRSGGDAMDFGWYGNRDVSAAVSFLVSRPEISPEKVAVVGLSMGGEEALTAAADDDRIKAVVAEGVSARTTQDLNRLPKTVSGYTQRVMEWIMWGASDLLTSANKPIDLRTAIERSSNRPVLLIAGRGETASVRYLRATSPSVQEWDLPDVAHTNALKSKPVEWEARVVGTLESGLQR